MPPPGKKYVVIPHEEYELLKSKTLSNNTLHNPMKQDLRRAEQAMNETLANNLPPDEKVRLFTEELNNMKKRYDDLTRSKPIRVVMDKKEEIEKDKSDGEEKVHNDIDTFLSEALVKTIPKQSRAEAKLLFEHLQNHPEIITWNKRGEIKFKGDELNGSNLIDLIANVMTNRKTTSGSLLHDTIFLKALSETNVPERWIKNKSSRKLLQSYKDVKETNPFSTPSSQRKKIKIDWVSST